MGLYEELEKRRREKFENAKWEHFLLNAKSAGFTEEQARFMYMFLASKEHHHEQWHA